MTTHDSFPVANPEREQTEKFPVKPLEQPLVPVGNFGVHNLTSMPDRTYGAHEGLIRVGDTITLDTKGMRDKLAGDGFRDSSAYVPFTGGSSSERVQNRHLAETELKLAAIVVAQERGIATPDWEAMTPEQQREFKGTGSDWVELGTNRIFMNRGLEVPVAEGSQPGEVLGKVGTYSVKEVKTGDSLVRVICVVDALGRQVVTGADPHALKLLESLGYSKQDTAPFKFDEIPRTDQGRDFINKSQGSLADTSWNIPIRRA